MNSTRTSSFVTHHSPLIARLLAYATVLVAFFLRAYRLADKNVWWDEGWSIWLSQKDLAWIALRTASDEHPPLHYWMLHFWDALAGTEAYAGRFLSLAFGVLTVALLYRIGQRVGGTWLGVLAAALLAVARFHVWWSQDIKNYTPSIFFAFAAVWFALELTRALYASDRREPNSSSANLANLREGMISEDSRTLADQGTCLAQIVRRIDANTILYALFAALALWTHYLAALVLLSLNLYALIAIVRAYLVTRRLPFVLLQWLVANLLAAALFVPWMIVYLQNASAWQAAPTFDFGFFLKLVATVLPLGVTTNIDGYAALTIGFTVLAAIGIGLAFAPSGTFGPRPPKAPEGSLLAFALIVLVPPVLIYALSLTPVSFFAPKIQPRYLLILSPAYVLLLAFGLGALRRFSIYLAAAALAFVLVADAFVLSDYYAGRRLNDDYATLANTINSFGEPGDLVLLNTDQEWPTFLYYLRAPLDWLGVPNGASMNASNADSLAQRALAQHDAVWLVSIPDALASDPQHLVDARLGQALQKQFEKTFGDKRLELYAPTPRNWTNVPAGNFAPQVARPAKIDDGLQLLGFDLPVHEAHAGDTLRIVTYWRAQEARTVLVCPAGFACDPTQVPPGGRSRAETDFVIPPETNADLTIRAGSIELAHVRAEPLAAIAPAGNISHPLNYRLGIALFLIGYDLPSSQFRAGESVPITLYWKAEQPVASNQPVETSYTVFVHLLGTAFNAAQGDFLWGQIDSVPRGGTYPTSAWQQGETVPDPYGVPIDPHAPAGTYKIEVGMYDAATGARLAVDAGGDSIVVSNIQIAP